MLISIVLRFAKQRNKQTKKTQNIFGWEISQGAAQNVVRGPELPIPDRGSAFTSRCVLSSSLHIKQRELHIALVLYSNKFKQTT